MRPVSCGPRSGAAVVITRTSAVAVIMRAGRSQRGAGVAGVAVPFGLTIAIAATAAIDPAAADAANAVPCSNARKSETGPEVNGSPTSQPEIDGPQRRPASV